MPFDFLVLVWFCRDFIFDNLISLAVGKVHVVALLVDLYRLLPLFWLEQDRGHLDIPGGYSDEKNVSEG